MQDFVQLTSRLPSVFNELRSGSKFISVMGYKNAHDEVANFSLAFHVSYERAVEKSLKIITLYEPKSDLEEQARIELIDSYKETLSGEGNSRCTTTNVYTPVVDGNNELIKGVKYNEKDNRLHLYGFQIQKLVLIPGVYPVKNKRPLTIAKDKLRGLVPVNKFRQYILEAGRFEHIGIEKMILTEGDLLDGKTE